VQPPENVPRSERLLNEVRAANGRRQEALRLNNPARYHEIAINEKISLRAWVHDNVAPRRVTRPRWSYGLKHVAEAALGFYVDNASIKGALIEAGYEPTDDDGINMDFRCGPKPGSRWAAEPKELKARRYQPNRHAKRHLRELRGEDARMTYLRAS
jgi:hypothetical protein